MLNGRNYLYMLRAGTEITRLTCALRRSWRGEINKTPADDVSDHDRTLPPRVLCYFGFCRLPRNSNVRAPDAPGVFHLRRKEVEGELHGVWSDSMLADRFRVCFVQFFGILLRGVLVITRSV